MKSYDEALNIIMDNVVRLGGERTDLESAPGRILAEHVVSDVDMPPFDKAAMDGYACRREDLGEELTVLETLAAGRVPTHAVGPKQCAKIMTGAVVPEGADCVVMVEYTKNPTETTMRFTGENTDDNICPRGEDVRTGDVVLKAGQLIRPQHIAVLASVGCVEPPVACRPRVGIISTGSELVSPSEKPEPSQIRDSNSSQLSAQVIRSGGASVNLGSAGDTEEAIGRAIEEAKSETDMVLLTGGVSMGDFDLVPDILEKKGFDILFAKVAVKPGKPTLFARAGDVVCFGLPGNPVSSYVMFELFVRPLLYGMMGHEWIPATSCATLAETYRRKKTERLSWVPVTLREDGSATPVEYHGPAHSGSLTGADGLIPVPVGVNELAKETNVTVRLI